MSRPRANTKAIRIIAQPYTGILYRDQFWTAIEWAAAERRRASWRRYQSKKRRLAAAEEAL